MEASPGWTPHGKLHLCCISLSFSLSFSLAPGCMQQVLNLIESIKQCKTTHLWDKILS